MARRTANPAVHSGGREHISSRALITSANKLCTNAFGSHLLTFRSFDLFLCRPYSHKLTSKHGNTLDMPSQESNSCDCPAQRVPLQHTPAACCIENVCLAACNPHRAAESPVSASAPSCESECDAQNRRRKRPAAEMPTASCLKSAKISSSKNQVSLLVSTGMRVCVGVGTPCARCFPRLACFPSRGKHLYFLS
jgi:hypothetical protein